MQFADIAILTMIALPALVGMLYGFLNIVFSLLAWGLALGISVKFSSYFSPLLANSIDTPILRNMLAFIGLFIISLVILTGIGFFIVKLLGRTGLTSSFKIKTCASNCQFYSQYQFSIIITVVGMAGGASFYSYRIGSGSVYDGG